MVAGDFDVVKGWRGELESWRSELSQFTPEQVAADDPEYRRVLGRVAEIEDQIQLHRPGLHPSSPEGQRAWQLEQAEQEVEALEARRAAEAEALQSTNPIDRSPGDEQPLVDLDRVIAQRTMQRDRLRQPPEAGVASENLDLFESLATDPPAVEPKRSAPPDDLTKRKGCTPTMLAGIGAVIAVILGIVVVVAMSGGDDDTAISTDDTTSEGGGVPVADTAAGTGEGDLSSYAGHYVLTSGLDDPTGRDAFQVAEGTYDITVEPGSASFDIDESGQITAGEYHAGFVGVGNINCTFAADGTEALGSIGLAGPGATGEIRWITQVTSEGDCDNVDVEQPVHRLIGIIDGNVVMCASLMEADLVTCNASYPRVAGTFERQ